MFVNILLYLPVVMLFPNLIIKSNLCEIYPFLFSIKNTILYSTRVFLIGQKNSYHRLAVS